VSSLQDSGSLPQRTGAPVTELLEQVEQESRAIRYAGLVGKYVRMSRPATPEEQTLTGHSEVGMEGVIVCVSDEPGGFVDVTTNAHLVWSVTPSDAAAWQFTIWPDEDARMRDVRVAEFDAL
jgi:hypothetical protein